MAWMNHAGTSWPKPEPVQRAIRGATTAEPSTWNARLEADRASIAARIGVSDPDRWLPTPGCTAALGVAVADHPWAPGDRLLLGPMEHHALHRPCLKLAEAGVEIAGLRRGPSGIDLEHLERELKRGARLVALSAAANTTGELVDTGPIVELAHGHGALVLVDAAQVAGWFDGISNLGDLVCFAGHKGPQAPWGIGGLIVAPHVLMKSPAASCDPPEDGEMTACALMPGYCDVGSVDRIALAGLAAGLEWLVETPAVRRLERARAQLERVVHGALSMGWELHGPRDPERRMPTAAFTVPGLRPAEVGRRFAAEGIQVSAGLQCAPLAHRTLGTEPHGVVRFSVGPTTTDSDIEQVLAALEDAWPS